MYTDPVFKHILEAESLRRRTAEEKFSLEYCIIVPYGSVDEQDGEDH